MTLSFEQLLANYANLAVKVGVNIQPGQRLVIRAPIDAAPLVRLIAASAYRADARYVDVLWQDDQVTLSRFQYAPRDSFGEFPQYLADGLTSYAQNGDAFISVSASDPDLLKDQDPALIAQSQRAMRRYLAPYYDHIMRDAVNWCVISAPIQSWAAKVFPDRPVEEQLQALWDTIFAACRVNQNDPVTAWQEHIKNLLARSGYLNHKQYTALNLTGPQTDLTIGLPQNHIWKSGQSISQNDIRFTANIPTEEVFTLPHKDQTEGVISASKPLNYSGTLIEKFSLTFEQGRVIKMTAEKGEAVLKGLLEIDEGAGRLGEIALVPDSSPISQAGLLFYNTLFDENAASHVALGRAYKFNLQDGPEMTDAEFGAAGGNHSLTHVDFMVGSADMDVDGLTAAGETEPVMRHGEWAFDV